MTKALVIVESPTKAKTIQAFLGKDYLIKASYGHVRDLPNNAAEIPAEQKKHKWSRLGIDVESDFQPLYIIPDKKKKNVAELKRAVKEVSEILLATDEDREGESISWHLLEVLRPKVKVKRMVFHEITKEAIREALSSPREVDLNLVRAQETRRIVDRLFGYEVSPLLWKKMAPRLSAGRVQSVAIRLLVERERERIRFKSASYCDLKALLSKHGGKSEADRFEAELAQVNGRRVASGRDFDPYTGRLKQDSDAVHFDRRAISELAARIKGKPVKVLSIERKPFTSKPAAPFTTSTLQQEASRKLNFAAKRTMAVAQTLYENGLITYMRTDSTILSEEALSGARRIIEHEYGIDYMHPEPRIYKTKVKNAQEAHEAIRPAGADFASLSFVKAKFGLEAYRLYELIWKRTVASQMKDSRGTRVAVQLGVEDCVFRASGSTIEFPGFLRAYVEGSDDPEAELAEREKILPALSDNEILDLLSLEELEHITQPPPRYTEGTLIKELERLGIGRPSTWATIVDLVLSRDYAFKRGTALVPTFLATAVIGLMEEYFGEMVNYEFTARLEDDLDSISRGEADSLSYLRNFYFGDGHAGLKSLVEKGAEVIDPRKVCGVTIGDQKEGSGIEVRIGRWGPFLSDGENRAGLPEGIAPDELTVEKAREILASAARGPEALGTDPESGMAVYLKKGRFGPYLQLGENGSSGEKPKMASLLSGMKPEDLTLETALKLLALPRSLGVHPETGVEVVAANGRYGPYIKCGSDTRSITAEEITPINITLEQAVALLKEPKRMGRAAAKPATMKEIGVHPESGHKISLKSGRYGPYVTDGQLNASLPRGADPEAVTLEEALSLLQQRAEYIESQGGAASSKGRRGKASRGRAAGKAKKAAGAKKARKK